MKDIPVSMNQEVSVTIVGIGNKNDAIAKIGNQETGYTIIIKNSGLKIGDKVIVRIVQVGNKFARGLVVSNIDGD